MDLTMSLKFFSGQIEPLIFDIVKFVLIFIEWYIVVKTMPTFAIRKHIEVIIIDKKKVNSETIHLTFQSPVWVNVQLVLKSIEWMKIELFLPTY